MEKSFHKKAYSSFKKLLSIIKKLCSEDGCPWDRKQTHKTLIRYLNEEVREFRKAVMNNDYDNMKEELGDILLQVVFHSEIASKNGKFDIGDVIESLNRKLVRRHPHVFGNMKCSTPAEVEKLWRRIKEKED